MSKAAKSKLAIAGVALILCLPVFAVAAGLYCYFAPREYYARTTIEYSRPNIDDLRQAFSAAVLPFRQSADLQNVRNTSLYEIGVYHLDPQEAANRANTIALTLQQTLGADDWLHVAGAESDPDVAAIESRMRGRAVKIWERAERPAAPSRPNVFVVMLLGVASGIFVAVIGGVLLIVASSRSTPVVT
jgi:capsular polysaccharide biosynthesis protein